ncbi:hypothetical protein HUG10_20715 (plasmid) [Halorarum halophilum]|uniref:DUF1059 domain-containing protein n=1 Tax=Halorarum halophilum TaxID=2743090 RepID=A0A7D5GKS7_9EURY|nr:hypothetical protein [Halobaculum halophilum]QLG30031.1 hypothetical protein HUG10_20715 [Halobaculum halophilum]
MTKYRVTCEKCGLDRTFDKWDDAHAVVMSHWRKPGHEEVECNRVTD